jgi:hypothetical protein
MCDKPLPHFFNSYLKAFSLAEILAAEDLACTSYFRNFSTKGKKQVVLTKNSQI